jgi:hypothetical protein
LEKVSRGIDFNIEKRRWSVARNMATFSYCQTAFTKIPISQDQYNLKTWNLAVG